MLRFSILGAMEIRDDSREIKPSPRERTVLALLLLRANHVVPTDELVDRLWNEEPPPTATTSLQNTIRRLRDLLGDDLIETRGRGYAIRIEPEQLDLNRFDRLCEQARSESPIDRARTLREALDLWREEPLDDLAFEPCLQEHIRWLSGRRLDALEDRIGADLELGRYAEVVNELESLVSQHGDRQKLVAHLMLALYQAGRDIDANAAFRKCAALLDEVGLLPRQELQELHRAILRHDPSLRPHTQNGGAQRQPDRYSHVVRALLDARLVPVLGPQACAAPSGAAPDPAAAAERLADMFGYPHDRARTLTRVSQYVAVTHGMGPLYDALHDLYCHEFEPGPVHRALAAIPSLLRARAHKAPVQAIVITTSFDRTLERAFQAAGEPIDVISYVAIGRSRGKFVHLRPDGSARVIDEPNVDVEPIEEDRTLVLKIHGGAHDLADRDGDSYVVSEDDYIDFLAHTQLSTLLPVGVTARLNRSHFLFLGYDLDDWSLRVFLRRLWGNERVGYRSWAVTHTTDAVSDTYWSQCGVQAFDVPLEEYVEGLRRHLETEPAVEPEPVT